MTVYDLPKKRKEEKLEVLRELKQAVGKLIETTDTRMAPYGSASYGALAVLHNAAITTAMLILRDIERLERDVR